VPLSIFLWLALLAVLIVLFVVTLRRMSQLIARTRGLERFQRAVADLERRFTGSVGPLVLGLEDTRRHAGDPAALHDRLTEAQTVLVDLRRECTTMPAPVGLSAAVAGLAGDLDRAIRAASLIEHGLNAAINASLGRDLEAQTSLKRGALNLRHSHEAFTTRAREVAALSPADIVPGAVLTSAVAAPMTVYPAGEHEDQ
jgi:hypothetical protein